MSFKISRLADLDGADSLMVAKIVDYPLAGDEYKPFAQARLCRLPNALAVQLWAFEANPTAQSNLRTVLRADGKPMVSAQLWSDGRLEVLVGDAPACLTPCPGLCTLHPLWGEDLQGVYWGGSLLLDVQRLEALWGANSLEPGRVLRGNLYKLSDNEQKPHMGSLFPADFTGGDPYGSPSMGEFEFVTY